MAKLQLVEEGGPTQYLGPEGSVWHPGDTNTVDDDEVAARLLEKRYFNRVDGPSGGAGGDSAAESGGTDDEDSAAIGGNGDLTDLPGVGDDTADDLRAAGYENAEDVENADVDELTDVDGIGEATAAELAGEE